MAYRHFDLIRAQSSKREGVPCGDVFASRRDFNGTNVILCDGMGSGMRAHLAAEWYATRFMALLGQGSSFRRSFDALCRTLATSRGKDPIWAAIIAVRIRPDGETTILSHEMPGPLIVSGHHVDPLPLRTENREGCLVEESLTHLQPGDGLLFYSDGVSQSGLRMSRGIGWGVEEISIKATQWLRDGMKLTEIPERLREQAERRRCLETNDDISVGTLVCREGLVLNLLTGPPSDAKRDESVVGSFLRQEGLKVVCGATTAALVAKQSGCEMTVDTRGENPHVPPEYFLESVDLATEGTVTLSQVCRLLDTDISGWDARHAVAKLTSMLQAADAVRITAGLAVNTANKDLIYRQIGVLTRREIVCELRDKLLRQDKTVDLTWV